MSNLTSSADITVNVSSSLYSLSDANGDDLLPLVSSFTLDSDGDVLIDINGYVIDSEEYELLEKARSLTSEDWDLIATSNLID